MGNSGSRETVGMAELRAYLDYRKFLRDRYLEKQAGDGKFTHRVIGQVGGFDPGLFSKVIFGQRNISRKLIPGFCKAFGLIGDEAEYFKKLVFFNQAGTFEKKKASYEKLLAEGGRKVVPVARNQYEFYSDWRHSAIREILNYHPFRGDFKELGKLLHPAVGARAAKKSVALLERLGMIRRTRSGGYELADRQVTSGIETKSVEIDSFILQCMELAVAGLKRIPGNKRNFSTLTFSIPRDKIPALEDRIRAFRKDTSAWIRKQRGQDSVYQFNLQLFPMTSLKRRKKDA
jgi:uncharacterized protein (TIGR02147 family)